MAFEWLKGFLGKLKGATTTEASIETAFQKKTAVSKDMTQNINLWYSMYINEPPWESCDTQSIGIPGAIVREFSRTALTEFTTLVSGSPRADYINEQLTKAEPALVKALELGLAIGGVALKPVISGDRLSVDYTSLTAFTPTRFGNDGEVLGGVFREVRKHNGQTYVRMEDHEFIDDGDGTVYRIRNKAYNSSTGGQPNGQELPLNTVPDWANVHPEVTIRNLERPLFGFFKVPRENNVDFGSDVGVSIFGGAAVGLIRQADEQWGRLIWEYESGERKVFIDGTAADAKMYGSRLFEFGPFGGASGDFFKDFNPAMRDGPLYDGFQRILQRIEFETGLAYGDLSDPQSVEKTATEIRTSRQRKYVTVGHIQNAFQGAIEDLVYAMDAFCDIYQLVPRGQYEVTFTHGDAVLDDPDGIRQDKALDLQEVNAGIMADWEYRAKWYGETEEEAKANLPGLMGLTTEPQEVIE